MRDLARRCSSSCRRAALLLAVVAGTSAVGATSAAWTNDLVVRGARVERDLVDHDGGLRRHATRRRDPITGPTLPG